MNEGKLKIYFLGKLSQSEAEDFEEEIALDADLTERAQIVEEEMIDDYLSGNLLSAERILFEANYLTTEARRKKLKFADNLRDGLRRQTQMTILSETKARPSFWQSLSFPRLSFAALGGLLFLSAFLFFRSGDDRKPEISQLGDSNQTTAQKNEDRNFSINQKDRDTNSDSASKPVDGPVRDTPDEKTKIFPPPVTKKVSPKPVLPIRVKNNPPKAGRINTTKDTIEKTVTTQDSSIGNNFVPKQMSSLPPDSKKVGELLALQPDVRREGYVAGGRSDQSQITLDGREKKAPTFLLLPKSLRGADEQSIKIPAATNRINLRLKLPKSAKKYQAYTATLQTPDGAAVLSFPNLKSFNLTLPPDKLENRTYLLLLEGRNAQDPAEPLAEYTFRVRR